MKLELTPEEYTRLTRHLEIADNRGNPNRCKTTREREMLIVAELKRHTSNMEIRRQYKTSDMLINKIKRKYGMWGV